MSIVIKVGNDRISSRVRTVFSNSTMTNAVLSLRYTLMQHDDFSFARGHLFTVILTAHYGSSINYFKKSVESVLSQDDGGVELIMVDHGCGSELSEYMRRVFEHNINSKLLVFPENHYDPRRSDLSQGIGDVWNAALLASEGEFFYFLSYDDYISRDYVRRMVGLFCGSDCCVVATPRVVSVNEFSEINVKRTEEYNRVNSGRQLYEDGMHLVYNKLMGASIPYAAPGGYCAYRTDLVLSAGGLDAANDLNQLYKFAVRGLIGTDNNAILYWRHHESQTNKVNTRFGMIYYRFFLNWIDHMVDYYVLNGFSVDYIELFREHFRRYLNDEMRAIISHCVCLGPTATYRLFVRIMIEAPHYVGYFFLAVLKCLLLTPPRLICRNMPNQFCSKLRSFLMRNLRRS